MNNGYYLLRYSVNKDAELYYKRYIIYLKGDEYKIIIYKDTDMNYYEGDNTNNWYYLLDILISYTIKPLSKEFIERRFFTELL